VGPSLFLYKKYCKFLRAAGILDEYLVKGYKKILFTDFMIIRVYVTLLALTN
jgi:hypothetical protein